MMSMSVSDAAAMHISQPVLVMWMMTKALLPADDVLRRLNSYGSMLNSLLSIDMIASCTRRCLSYRILSTAHIYS